MRTLEAAAVAAEDLTALSELTEELPDASPLRDFLNEVLTSLRDGADVSVVANEKQMTPSAAAKLLGVSRVHVYKLMDHGDLKYTRVGNDRRTSLGDVLQFQSSQDAHRRTMAERAAHPDLTRQAAIDALLSD
jgi:excisionase family DNA binding protein